MYQKKWDTLLGKAAKCPRCFFDIELDGEKAECWADGRDGHEECRGVELPTKSISLPQGFPIQ